MLLSATLCNFAVGLPTLAHMEPLWWITATTTIASGLMYMDGSGRAKIVSKAVRAVVAEKAERVTETVKIVGQSVKSVENRVKQVIVSRTSSSTSASAPKSSHNKSDRSDNHGSDRKSSNGGPARTN